MNLAKLRAAAVVFVVGFVLGISVFAASRLFVRSVLAGDAVAAAEILASRLARGQSAEGGAGFSIISRYRLVAPDGRVLASGSADPDAAGGMPVPAGTGNAGEPVVLLSPLGPSLLGLTETAVRGVALPATAPDGSRAGTLYAEFDQRMAQDSLGRAFAVVGMSALCLGVLAFAIVILVVTRSRNAAEKRSALDVSRLARDPMTGFLTRPSFEVALEEAASRAGRAEAQLALLAIDIDGLRQANITWGHSTGDRLLRLAAERLATFVRGDGQAARIGSGEFAMIVEGDVHSRALRMLGADIAASLSAPYEVDGTRIPLSARVGIALYPVNAGDAEALFRAADTALGRAKHERRQSVVFFDTEMQRSMERRAALEHELRTAIAEDQFVVFYQPQLDLASGRLRGYEALVRWDRPGEGIVGPAEFLSVAEETGLLAPIGEWVLRKACADAASWLESGSVAVNFHRSQFLNGDLAETVEAVLKETGLAPERLELEVAESIFLENDAEVMETLKRIKGSGVKIAIDNFGKGYSGLAALVSFPFDKLKIDRSFVAQLVEDPEVAAIVASIIGLGRSLSFDITAEGVESSEQVALLKAAGCSIAQGFLFGAPQRDTLPGGPTPLKAAGQAT